MEDYIKELIKSLKDNGKVYNTTGGREIRVSCPYCGDRHHKNDPKMYISLEPPFKFHCFRCENSGALNNKTLQDFKINDSDLAQEINAAAKVVNKNTGKKRKKNNNILMQIENEESVKEALEYFNNRYGTNYGKDDIPNLITKYKLILDGETFIKVNKAKQADYFDYSRAIGFVSSDKNYAIFRSTYDDKLRYSNVSLGDPDGSKMFTLGTDVDIMSKKVDLIITEGIFDIIGVYEHFYKDRDNLNRIFAANCGKQYRSTIEKIIKMGFLNLNIIIYSDADVDVEFYRDLKDNYPILKNNRITIYYNNIGKDYGVKKSEISLRKVVI